MNNHNPNCSNSRLNWNIQWDVTSSTTGREQREKSVYFRLCCPLLMTSWCGIDPYIALSSLFISHSLPLHIALSPSPPLSLTAARVNVISPTYCIRCKQTPTKVWLLLKGGECIHFLPCFHFLQHHFNLVINPIFQILKSNLQWFSFWSKNDSVLFCLQIGNTYIFLFDGLIKSNSFLFVEREINEKWKDQLICLPIWIENRELKFICQRSCQF